jgi:hypothetical protein
MAARGCLLPLLPLLLGSGVGGAIGGMMGAIWGGVAGFLIGRARASLNTSTASAISARMKISKRALPDADECQHSPTRFPLRPVEVKVMA